MYLLVGLSKLVQLLANRSSTPDRIEVGLGKWLMDSVYLRYRTKLRGGDFVGCNADDGPVPFMETPLHNVHVANIHPVHVPYTRDGRPEWAGN
jgi:hypothetical protein